MGHDAYTEDMGDIMSCARERRMAMQILQAWDSDGLPTDFYEDGVKFAFNRSSGNVFLVNEDHQVAMMNGDVLESFYTSPYEGKEGFFADLLTEYAGMHREDQEWFRELAKDRDLQLDGEAE
jgi:hypothetical protein